MPITTEADFVIRDTTKPVIVTQATSNSARGSDIEIDAAFQTWISNHGGATAVDTVTDAVNLEWSASSPSIEAISRDDAVILGMPSEPLPQRLSLLAAIELLFLYADLYFCNLKYTN